MSWLKERFPAVIIIAAFIPIYLVLAWNYQSDQNTPAHNHNGEVEKSINDVYAPRVSGSIEEIPRNSGQGKAQNKKSIEPPIQNAESLQVLDHKAQIQMAKAAWFGFGLGVVGTFLISWTLMYTRQAARLTDEALTVTKETSYKELRAYLSIELDAVPLRVGMESLAVNVTIRNMGQTPAYNIRMIYSLYNATPLWGPRNDRTSAILNPGESFSPTLVSKFKNAAIVRETEHIYLNLHIVFTDMNNRERWLKCLFSKKGVEWPEKRIYFKSPRVSDTGKAEGGEVIDGTFGFNLVSMETGDLQNDTPYKM